MAVLLHGHAETVVEHFLLGYHGPTGLFARRPTAPDAAVVGDVVVGQVVVVVGEVVVVKIAVARTGVEWHDEFRVFVDNVFAACYRTMPTLRPALG